MIKLSQTQTVLYYFKIGIGVIILHVKYKMKRVVVSNLSVSFRNRGNRLVQQLENEIAGITKEEMAYPITPIGNKCPARIATLFLDNGYTKEEMKAGTANHKKYFNDRQFSVMQTAVPSPPAEANSEFR